MTDPGIPIGNPDIKMTEGVTTRDGYYTIGKMLTIDALRKMFPLEGDTSVRPSGPDDLNWVFFGTSGIHGSYGGVNQLFDENYTPWVDPVSGEVDDDLDHITILVVQPRIVRMYYGNVDVRRADLPYLRELARLTQIGVNSSQDSSWTPPTDA